MGLGRTSADGGDVSPKLGRKSKLTQSPLKSEAHAVPLCQRWVVHVATTLGISLLLTGKFCLHSWLTHSPGLETWFFTVLAGTLEGNARNNQGDRRPCVQDYETKASGESLLFEGAPTW